MSKALVIAADNSYTGPLETLLKSICRHHKDLHIYIFNQDIAPEWFRLLASKVALSGNLLTDIKLGSNSFGQDWDLVEHIASLVTYARYYIPQYVSENRVLYMDSDTLVTGDLSPLFELDMQGYPLAAVREAIDPIRFNAGVLLIDNSYWKQQDVTHQLIQLTNERQGMLTNGDQEILNHYFKGQWLHLDDTYNYQIGFDLHIHLMQEYNGMMSKPVTEVPLVIHYLSKDKPWRTYSSHRLRQVWWYYFGLEWSEIILQNGITRLPKTPHQYHLPTHALIMTHVQEIEYLEELLKALPDVYFHVAAYTNMGDGLLELASYPNLVLHPTVTDFVLDELLETCLLYLDINYGPKETKFLERVMEREIPILAFRQSSSNGPLNKIFESHEQGLQEIILEIKAILKN